MFIAAKDICKRIKKHFNDEGHVVVLAYGTEVKKNGVSIMLTFGVDSIYIFTNDGSCCNHLKIKDFPPLEVDTYIDLLIKQINAYLTPKA